MSNIKLRDPFSLLLRILVWIAAGLTASVLFALVGYILVKGGPKLTPELFTWKYTSENCSMIPALLGTLAMTALALAIAAPLGSSPPSTWQNTRRNPAVWSESFG